MINLIEQLGGYDRAKAILYAPPLDNNKYLLNGIKLEDALLQYRRQHGIFEKGDKVVYQNLSHHRIFGVRYVGGDEIVVYELWDEMGAKTFTEFSPYSDIRHATDEEIAQGFRDEND